MKFNGMKFRCDIIDIKGVTSSSYLEVDDSYCCHFCITIFSPIDNLHKSHFNFVLIVLYKDFLKLFEMVRIVLSGVYLLRSSGQLSSPVGLLLNNSKMMFSTTSLMVNSVHSLT